MVDLTLKLGLSNDDDENQSSQDHVNPFLMLAAYLDSVNASFNRHQKAENNGTTTIAGGGNANLGHDHYGTLINGRRNPEGYGNYGTGNGIGRSSQEMGKNHLNHQVGVVVGMPAVYHPNSTSCRNLNVPGRGDDIISGMKNAFDFGMMMMRSYTTGLGRRGSRRRCSSTGSGRYITNGRRCANYNCNTSVTPMWRRGPLGPKTLCNACGIKYRKEEGKKKKDSRSSNLQSPGKLVKCSNQNEARKSFPM